MTDPRMECRRYILPVILLTAGLTLVSFYQNFHWEEKYVPPGFSPGSARNLTGEKWFNPPGSFEQRVDQFNRILVTARKLLLDERGNREWQNIKKSGLNVVWGNYEDFFEKLSSYPNVNTLFLTWSDKQVDAKSAKVFLYPGTLSPNFLLTDYYIWIVSDPLCRWISLKGGTKMHYDAVHNKNCSTNTSLAKYPISLEQRAFNAKPVNKIHYWPNNGLGYPSWFYTEFPKFVFYIHMVQDAVITNNGDFITKNLKYVPYSCGTDLSTSAPAGYENAPLYDEVFIIKHYWGSGYFHRMLEDFPRMVPYIAFLKTNPSVKILVPANDKLTKAIFSILNINPDRVITGVVRAKLAYMPRPTHCGFPLVQESQLFSKLLNNYTEKNLKPTKRNKIVLIRRSKHRYFTDQKGIEQMTKDLAKEYNLDFAMWRDDPVPPLEVGLRMFHEALMVVAPHGAGLSNILFCQPGTYVIEGVCNRPHVNLCYQHAAHILGHRYHGIPSRGGCERHIEITANDLKPVLKTYLTQIKLSLYLTDEVSKNDTRI